jgi:electron-transferring-flavoprotein dehydrogenase
MGRRILLAGCGDLGARLAKRLIARGDTVFGLRRRVHALAEGIVPVAADLNDPSSLGGLPQALDAVVCTMTPASRDEVGYRRAYLDAPRNLLAALGEASPRWVFASSTAVYGGDSGDWVDDDTVEAPEEFNGHVLLQAEQALAAAVVDLKVLRFTGIYGPGRLMMLRRARTASTAEPRWTNRIHAEDAAAALLFALDHSELPAICIASDGSPAREDAVLGWLAAQLGRPAPVCGDGPERGRKIVPKRLIAAGFVPVFPDFRTGYSSLLQDAE